MIKKGIIGLSTETIIGFLLILAAFLLLLPFVMRALDVTWEGVKITFIGLTNYIRDILLGSVSIVPEG